MHVTVYLICALVTALMAAYGIWRTIRIAHLGTTSKLAVTAFFALAGASHFVFLDMTDLFERAFIVDTLPVTGLFVSFAYWFFLLALARDVIGGVRGLVRRKMGLPRSKRHLQRNPAHHVHASQLIEQLFEHSRHEKASRLRETFLMSLGRCQYVVRSKTAFCCVNSSRPARPLSRPMPLCL